MVNIGVLRKHTHNRRNRTKDLCAFLGILLYRDSSVRWSGYGETGIESTDIVELDDGTIIIVDVSMLAQCLLISWFLDVPFITHGNCTVTDTMMSVNQPAPCLADQLVTDRRMVGGLLLFIYIENLIKLRLYVIEQ